MKKKEKDKKIIKNNDNCILYMIYEYIFLYIFDMIIDNDRDN